ncbi:pyrroline-5-carboxylate reductase [Salinispira pacifica]
MKSIGIVGFGTMGEAIVRGLQARDRDIAASIIDKRPERRNAATQLEGVTDLTERPEEIRDRSDLIVLAVKPQDLDNVVESMGHVLAGNRIVSILAGTSINSLLTHLPGCSFVRFMPNLAASLGRAAVGVAIPADTLPEFRADALTVAKAIGVPFELPERLLAAFTGLSGSGIAYVFQFIHALALGGTRAGITYEQSLEIALQVVKGAASLLSPQTDGPGQTGEAGGASESSAVPPLHPQELLSKVISPAGTTIDGIRALERGGFTASVMEAVVAAARRADRIEQ